MLKLDVLAAELNLWANETEQIYRATKEIKYRRDVTHLRYLAATLNQSSLSTGVTQIIAGSNISISPTTGVGAVTINASTVNGLPPGGTAGQILAKIDSVNYNAEWIDNYANWTSVVKQEVKAGEAINKGQAVYVSSADGTNIIVSKASNTTEATSSKTLGLLAQNLATNGKGFVITEGMLSGLDTSAASAGDPVWLGASGNLIYGIVNKPYAPLHLVFIGIVTRSNNSNGEIFVKVQNGFELDELHNVDARNPNNNDGIFFNSSTNLWEHKPVSAVYTTPTLNAVTTAGNTTTNAITVGGVTVSNGVISATKTTSGSVISITPASSDNAIEIFNNGYIKWNNAAISYLRQFSTSFSILDSTYTSKVLFHWGGSASYINTGGNLLINTTTDAGYNLDVNGTAKFRGNFDIVTSSNTNVLLAYSSYVQAWQSFYVSQSGGAHNFSVSNASSGGNAYFNNVNVGIGTSSPAAKMHIVADGASGLTIPFRVETNTNRLLLQTEDGGTTRIGGPTARLYVNVESGGTSSTLVVNGSAHFGNGLNNAGALYVDQGGTSSSSRTIWYNGSGGVGNVIQGEGFSYFNGGNLLIGTTTDAGYKLDVNGTARFITNAYINPTTNGQVPAYVVEYGGEIRMVVGSNGAGGNSYFNGTAGRANLAYAAFFGSAAGYATQIGTSSGVGLTLLDNGNIGIGTTSPTDKLHIVDNTNGNKFGRIAAGGTDASAAWVAQNDQTDNVVYRVFGSAVTGSQMGISLARSASLIANLGGSGKFLIGTYSSTDLVFGTGDQQRMQLVASTGNLLVGTLTDYGYKLSVGGSIYATSNVTANGNLRSMYQYADEGGEITLNAPATSTSIDTSVTIDVYQNKLRIFESGGVNRGGYFDISALANGVGTNFAPTGWTGTINITTMPPISIQVVNGIITNVV